MTGIISCEAKEEPKGTRAKELAALNAEESKGVYEQGMCNNVRVADPGERFDMITAAPYGLALADPTSDERLGGYGGDKMWPVGSEIAICFLESSKGNEVLYEEIFSIGSLWSQFGNLSFKMVQDCDAADVTIRVHDDSGDDSDLTGSWSYLGVESRDFKPSMNLGWAARPGLSKRSLRRVVLHEFGHMIGMAHEHLKPGIEIPWDEAAVMEYYGNFGWSEESIKDNVLTELDPRDYQFSLYDSASIMHYRVPNRITVGDFSVASNIYLSNGDKLWVSMAYPRAGVTKDMAKEVFDAYLGVHNEIPLQESFQKDEFPSDQWVDRPLADGEAFETAHPYDDNLETVIRYDFSAEGARFIRAKFSRIELEDSWDHLFFFAHPSTEVATNYNGRESLILSGDVGEDYMTLPIKGEGLSMRLTTDGSVSGYGVQLTGFEFNTRSVRYLGCTDPDAANFSQEAKVDNGSCVEKIVGCMDESSPDYLPEANTAGPCTLPQEETDDNDDDLVQTETEVETEEDPVVITDPVSQNVGTSGKGTTTDSVNQSI